MILKSLNVISRTSTSSLLNPNMNAKEIAHIVLKMIEKQTFATWYERDFEDYVVGEEGALSKQQILNDLELLINREMR